MATVVNQVSIIICFGFANLIVLITWPSIWVVASPFKYAISLRYKIHNFVCYQGVLVGRTRTHLKTMY